MVMKIFIIVIIFGFPVAVIFSWAFEITPEESTRIGDRAEQIDRAPDRAKDCCRNDRARCGRGWFVRVSARALEIRCVWIADFGNNREQIDRGAAFDNLSRDPDNAYFAEGVQDEILTRLAKVADLK